MVCPCEVKVIKAFTSFFHTTTCSPGQRGTPEPTTRAGWGLPAGTGWPKPGPGLRVRRPGRVFREPASFSPFARPNGSCSSAVGRPARPSPVLRFLYAPDEGEDSGQRGRAQRTPNYNSRWSRDSSTRSQVPAAGSALRRTRTGQWRDSAACAFPPSSRPAPSVGLSHKL